MLKKIKKKVKKTTTHTTPVTMSLSSLQRHRLHNRCHTHTMHRTDYVTDVYIIIPPRASSPPHPTTSFIFVRHLSLIFLLRHIPTPPSSLSPTTHRCTHHSPLHSIHTHPLPFPKRRGNFVILNEIYANHLIFG